MTRKEILDEAMKCVCTDRQSAYGTPEDNFSVIGYFWEIYLKEKYNLPALPISPDDVAMMMTLLKVGRSITGNHKIDTWVDIAGYAACGGEIADKKNTKKDTLIESDFSKQVSTQDTGEEKSSTNTQTSILDMLNTWRTAVLEEDKNTSNKGPYVVSTELLSNSEELSFISNGDILHKYRDDDGNISYTKYIYCMPVGTSFGESVEELNTTSPEVDISGSKLIWKDIDRTVKDYENNLDSGLNNSDAQSSDHVEELFHVDQILAQDGEITITYQNKDGGKKSIKYNSGDSAAELIERKTSQPQSIRTSLDTRDKHIIENINKLEGKDLCVMGTRKLNNNEEIAFLSNGDILYGIRDEGVFSYSWYSHCIPLNIDIGDVGYGSEEKQTTSTRSIEDTKKTTIKRNIDSMFEVCIVALYVYLPIECKLLNIREHLTHMVYGAYASDEPENTISKILQSIIKYIATPEIDKVNKTKAKQKLYEMLHITITKY